MKKITKSYPPHQKQYERMTNTTEEHWDATIKLYGVDTLEEFLVANDMLEPE